jgi:hypothetical protein
LYYLSIGAVLLSRQIQELSGYVQLFLIGVQALTLHEHLDLVLQYQWNVQLAGVEYPSLIFSLVLDLEEICGAVLPQPLEVPCDRSETCMQVLALLVLVIDFGTKLEVVAEEVHDHLLILKL